MRRKQRKWSEADVAYLRQHYPHVETKQLARMFETTPHAIDHVCARFDIRKVWKTADAKPLVLKAASTPEGMRADAVQGFELKFLRNLAHRMATETGELYRVKISHRNVRYFSDKAHADAYRISLDSRKNTVLPTVTVARTRHTRAPWTKDTEPYFPPGYKHTSAPTPVRCLHTEWGCGLSSFRAA